MTLALLSCCAPCSVGVLQAFYEQKRLCTILFFNPNIAPAPEYERRRDEQKRLCQELGFPFIELSYTPDIWAQIIKGLEHEPERGLRCGACFSYRLKTGAQYAKEHGFDMFTSVFGVSRYKNMEEITALGIKIGQEIGIPYLDTNWRKGGLEQKRLEGIKRFSLYQQSYCGCLYSKKKSPCLKP